MNTPSFCCDPSKVYQTVRTMIDDDRWRATNRAKINRLANGDPPFTEEEAEEAQIYTNVNFKEVARALRDARSQLNRAFVEQPTMVKITPDDGDANQRMLWGQIITEEFNRRLKRCPQYIETQESKFAGLVLHGIGPVNWDSDKAWIPRPVGVEDFLTPASTYCDLSNLTVFAIRRNYTAAELYKLVTKERAKEAGWNVGYAKALVTYLSGDTDSNPFEVVTQGWEAYDCPEKVAEDMKQNGFAYNASKVKTVQCFDFFAKRDDGKWVRRIIVSEDCLPKTGFGKGQNFNQFLFSTGDRAVSDTVEELVQTQIADGANVPPFRLHSVRSLGYFLYDLGHLSNRFLCREFDAGFRELMQLFRVIAGGETNGERKALIDMIDLGVIPNELQFVTAGERWQVNHQLVGQTHGAVRQMLSENTSAFTQDIGQRGGSTPMTATEALARSNVASTLMAAMLTKAYTREERLDREIFRRMLKSDDPEAKRFRDRCIARGVPKGLLNPDAVKDMDVVRPRALGGGNMTVEMLKAQALMTILDRLAPRSQQTVIRLYVSAFSDDPSLAADLVPMDAGPVTATQQKASIAFTMLLARKPPVLEEPIILGEFVPSLMGLLMIEITQLRETPTLPPLVHMEGVSMIIQYLAEQLALWDSQSPNGLPESKLYSDTLKEASKTVGQIVGAIMDKEQQAQGPAQDPETAARIQAMLTTAQAKAEIMLQSSALKAEQKQLAFQSDQRRKTEAHRADLAAKDAETQAAIVRANTEAALKPKAEKKPTKKK